MRPGYDIRFVSESPSLKPDWDAPPWSQVEPLDIASFRPESSAHRPQTLARLLYTRDALHGIFRVKDRFVRCTRTRYMDEVWRDSCVEIFLQPRSSRGYLNFEFNCGGAFLCCHIRNPERTGNGFKDFTRIPEEIARGVQVRSSLPPLINPETAEPLVWVLRFVIPFSLIEQFAGGMGTPAGQTWRGNLFKCAEDNSHPHWAAWSAVDEFNFHLPRCFGELRFAPTHLPAGANASHFADR